MMDFKDISNLNIKSIDSRPKENVGSLLKLFSSEYFTLDMAMIYLFKKRAETGVHDFLVNKLYEYNDYDIGFYIPQLCYMLLKTHSQTLERFLLDKCVKNVALFFKVLWCIKAYGQAERKHKKGDYDYVETVATKCEMAMVNGTIVSKVLVDPFGMPVKRQTDLSPQEIEAMVTEAERKRNRVEYLSETLRLINILVSISLKLKIQKIEDRKAILKSYVKRINKWLHYMRKKHAKDKDEYFRRLFYGIQLPFSSDSQDNSTQVVRILEDELTCFNTKKRAPYRIVLETIDMNELDFSGVPRHHEHHREVGDYHQSVLNTSLSQEEENWDDLIADQAREETVPAPQVSRQATNYKALADFGKIAKEEELKWKDASILKGVDLVQKYEVLQQKTGKTIQNLDKEKEEDLNAKRKPTLDFSEETKEVETVLETHKLNIKKFNQSFPRNPLLTRRQSFSLDDAEKIKRKKRSRSLRVLKGSDLIACMEKFKENSLPKRLLPNYVKVIDDLKQETFEHPSTAIQASLSLKSPIPPKEEEDNVVGWGPWEQLWEYKKKSIQEASPFGHLKSYRLRCVVVKANDDLRQELIVMQIIKKIKQIWQDGGLTLALRTYEILVTSNDSGILEFVIDTLSLDSIKKKNPGMTLTQFYTETFGYDFEEARKNFIDSLAAYSLVCYFLQIKDRHNGNILLDAHGFLIHIDFGFILTMSPGGINFESAPFKLTSEYVELMGGIGSATFIYFKMQLIKGFMELRKHIDSIVYILQLMMEGSDLPCFETFDINVLRERFKERSTDTEAIEYVSKLIENSYDNWRTVQYDNFQKYTNGILP